MKSSNKQFPQKLSAKFGPKSQSTTKHHIFRATNIRQSQTYYRSAATDAGEIKNVCPCNSCSWFDENLSLLH